MSATKLNPDRRGTRSHRAGLAVLLASIAALASAASAMAAPTAITRPASAIHHYSGVLNGRLDPDAGTVTECHFDWGVDTSYGQNAPCAEGNTFAAAADVSASVGFLTPGQTYHFRLHVTTSSSGDLVGADESFAPLPLSVIHEELGAFGPDGTSATTFPGADTATLGFNAAARQLFVKSGSAGSSGALYGFDVSSPLAFPLLPNFDPLALASVGRSGAASTVDSTTGPSAGNIYRLFPEGSELGDDQRVKVSATAGAFRLTLAACTTPDIAFNATQKAVEEALETCPGGDGAVVVNGQGNASGSSPYRVIFSAYVDMPQLVCSNGSTPLSGGSGCSVTTERNSEPPRISGFDSSGAPLGGNFPIDPTALFPLESGMVNDLAVDSSGDLWVANPPNGRLLEYSSAGAYLDSLDVSAEVARPYYIAFDTDDNLYVGGYNGIGGGSGSPAGTWRFSAVSSYADATLLNSEIGYLRLDSGNGHYFIGAREYDQFGNFLGTLPNSPKAVDSVNHYLYFADAQQVHVLGPPITVQPPPTIALEPASEVTGDSATLHASVDPETFQVSDCHFEWGLTASYGESAPCTPDPGSGSGGVEVSAELTDLNGGTVYHFRIVATNQYGTSKGVDQTLTTVGPRLRSSSIEPNSVTTDSAQALATIDPEGQSTSYHVEYGTTTAYGQSTAEQEIPAIDSADHPVSQLLGGLAPGTSYHARVVATNASGTVSGPDLLFVTFTPQPSFPSCANDQFRIGPSAALPDCRAYEQASPVDKDGNNIEGYEDDVQASTSGEAITFVNHGGLPGGEGSQTFPFFMARRGAGSWATHGLLPPASAGEVARMVGWTPDLALSFSAVTSRKAPAGEGSTLVMRDNAKGSSIALYPYAPGDNASTEFVAASTDHSKVYFENASVPLTPDAAPGQRNLYLYDRSTETVSLIGVLPDGSTPEHGSFAGAYDWFFNNSLTTGGVRLAYYVQEQHVVSEDGQKAFFGVGDGQIYMRENPVGPGASTVRVSAPAEGTPADPNGQKPAIFWQATPSGSIAYFTSCEKLTGDSTAVSTGEEDCTTKKQGQDLYAYDTATGTLSDLTVDANPTDTCPASAVTCGAQVQGVVGAGEDGSFVYFVANGDLDGSGPATLGDCYKKGHGFDYAGTCNLYLWHAGEAQPTFVAKLDGPGGPAESDAVAWQPTSLGVAGSNRPDGWVSADGKTVVFRSRRQLSAYDNQVGCTTDYPNSCPQFYRFNPEEGRSCLSCDPTGAAPLRVPTGSSISGNSQFTPTNYHSLRPRNLSANGKRFFFETPDRMVVADTNGIAGCPKARNQQVGHSELKCQDVYEWEAPGEGSCTQASSSYSPANKGCIYLISTGKSPEPSFFADAGASGRDAFIFTGDALVPQDGDAIVDVYDVREGGGLTAQHAVRPAPCEVNSGACEGQGSATPSIPGAATAAISGSGNPPVKRAKPHKRHHKAKRKKHARRHHKRAHELGHRRANAEGRAHR